MNFCRLLLGAIFVFSGFVKAVDPIGMVYKLNAYLAYWGIALEDSSLLLKFCAVALATFEFVLGVYIILGIRRRFTAFCTILFMTIMTGLTTYVYVFNPVADCGCFGDALQLSNGATLLKNIVLLISSVFVLLYWRYMRRLISERNQWLTSIYSWGYIIVLSLYSLHYLPVLDFTAYKKGVDIRAAWMGDTIGNVPDELVSLSFFSVDTQEDMTESVLTDTNYTFLLTLPKVSTADDGCNDLINDLHDECLDRGYHFMGVVGDQTDSLSLNAWIDRTGAAYDFFMCDAIQLKAMVRSNPGLLLIKEGVLLQKWSNNDLPVLDDSLLLRQCSLDELKMNSPLVRLVLWFLVPLFVVIMLDGIWIGRKYYKHYIFKKSLKQNEHEKENCSR